MSDTRPLRLLIAGGVAGGMSCAARARRLDSSAEITVLEAGPYVSFANCGLPYYVGGEITDDDDLLLHTPDSLKAALDLDVRVNTRLVSFDARSRTARVATPEGEQTLTWDALVLSPGGRAIVPDLPGSDRADICTLRSVDDAREVAQRAGTARTAAVIGAGFIGLEAAEALAQRGLAVTIIERTAHVLPPLERELATTVTRHVRDDLGIDVRTGVGAQAYTPAGVQLDDGTEVAADLVVVSVGVAPLSDVARAGGVACTERGAIIADAHGRTNVDGVYAVGDAVASRHATSGLTGPVALAGPANRAGRLVADALAHPGQARPQPDPLGTAIVRVGQLQVAMTGANRDQLAAGGRAFHTLHLHPKDHAGYFPGAETLALVVHVGADGALLGAQGVGRAGVDKRIDVLATAMRFGARVDDLIDLDLCYSPPFGQAKDAVNLVGMVGQNVRTGLLSLWYADQARDLPDVLVLDVRSRGEFASGHLPGALNIPHTELRERLDEVRSAAAGRPVYTMCAAGVRSWIATCVLRDAGFDVTMLSGGMATLRAWWGDAVTELLEDDQ